MNDLFLLLERQVQFVRKQSDHRLFLALPSLVDFIQREPRLRAIADTIAQEFDSAAASYRIADRHCANEVWDLFENNAEWTTKIYGKIAGTNLEEPLRFTREKLRECIQRSGDSIKDPRQFRKADTSQAQQAIAYLKSFFEQLEYNEIPEGDQTQYREAVNRLAEISWDHQRAHFRHVHAMSASAGASWRMLLDFAAGICPAVPGPVEGDSWYHAYLKAEAFKKHMADADILLGIDRSQDGVRKYEEWKSKAEIALEFLLQDMALRIGIYLSHRALVMRFKTKCEMLLADDLRAAMAADSTQAESHATRAAAGFLFDHGLNPLVNAPIVTLRPDLLDARLPHALYIEVKQYADVNPRRMVVKAVWQVWDTWNQLDSQHRVREAFLLVFRRSGPSINFDECARLSGRTLYPILVDIAKNAEKGSKAKESAIHITASDLLPHREGEPE